jgi:hypothetical protein
MQALQSQARSQMPAPTPLVPWDVVLHEVQSAWAETYLDSRPANWPPPKGHVTSVPANARPAGC